MFLDSKTLSDHPTVNGYLTLSIAGEGEGGEEGEWCSNSVTPLPVLVGSQPATFPQCYSLWEKSISFTSELHVLCW